MKQTKLMTSREIWMRLGITLYGTDEQIERVIKGDYDTLVQLLQDRKFEIIGDSYIPEKEVGEYNKCYNTDHEVGDVGFEL